MSVNIVFGQTIQEIDWLNKQIKSIETVNPEQTSNDLKPFLQLAMQARLIGLGECTHGSREIFQMKHRLLRALVEQSDSVVFALEIDFAGAQIVNDYVSDSQGDSLSVLKALGYWTWKIEEIWQMIQWIRVHNQSHIPKIIFSGFDINIPFPALSAVRQFAIEQRDSDLIHLVDELDSLHRKPALKTSDWYWRIKKLSEHLSEEVISRNASIDLQHSTQMLVQHAEMKGKGKQEYKFRDECMAANINWLVNRFPKAKLVIWAHNGHIQKRNGSLKSMGYYLYRKFGLDYLSLGFAVGKGTFTAVRLDSLTNRGQLHRNNHLTAPVVNSFENWFSRAALHNFFLDLRSISSVPKEGKWLTQKKLLRHIGAINFSELDSQFRPDQQLIELYDVLVYLDQTSSSHSYVAK